MKKILILDNYDSFTQNLFHLLFDCRPFYSYSILRNGDRNILNKDWDMVVISPGPGYPSETGLLRELFDSYLIPSKIPVLGICLGFQFMPWYYGVPIVTSDNPSHGKLVQIETEGEDFLNGIPNRFSVMRYNSLTIGMSSSQLEKTTNLRVLAKEKESGQIMALKHRSLPWGGVQFHPESFLTEYSSQMIENFFRIYMDD